jgi:hypothetical protein
MSIVNDDKGKQKSIIIDGKLHSKLKLYCLGKGLKIGSVVTDLIAVYINNPKHCNELIDGLDKTKKI